MRMSQNIRNSYLKAMEIRERGDYRTARERFRITLAEARRTKDRVGEANVLIQLGGIAQDFDRDFVEARKLFSQCLDLCTQINFELGRAHAMSNLGTIALEENNVEDAIRWAANALAIFDQISDTYGQAMTLHQLGVLHRRQGVIDQAENHLQRSLFLFETLGDKYAVAQVLISLSALYIEVTKDFPTAKSALHRAIDLLEELGLPAEAAKARHNLSFIEKSD